MKLLANPAVPLALGLLLGSGTGIGIFWKEARAIALAVRAQTAAAHEPVQPEKPWDFWTLEIENLAAELKDQKASLAAREQTVASREERLAADLRELDKTRAQIEGLRATVIAELIKFEAEEAKTSRRSPKPTANSPPRPPSASCAKWTRPSSSKSSTS